MSNQAVHAFRLFKGGSHNPPHRSHEPSDAEQVIYIRVCYIMSFRQVFSHVECQLTTGLLYDLEGEASDLQEILNAEAGWS